MIKRELYLKRIRPFYESDMIKVITGIRRCGKSTMMLQIMDELMESGVEKDRIIYINFELYEYKAIANDDGLYEYILEQVQAQGKYYILIDEIQNVDGFERVINSFRVSHDVSIFITGSNSRLLSGELATHLSGRTLSFRVMPFTFKEYCEFLGEIKDLSECLQDYMMWGGFPMVANEEGVPQKNVVLENIYDAVVLKDIVMRNDLSSPMALERVLEYVVANSSLTVSGNKISEELTNINQKVSSPKVYEYIKYIEEACICDSVQRYDIRGKKLLSYEEKVYVCDPGLFTLKKNRVKEELSNIVETVIYNELIARGYKVFVGKTYKSEVDFIVEKGQEKFYIQAAYLLSSEEVVRREFGAYAPVNDHYPKYVISMDPITQDRDGIKHLKLIDFLLGDL